MFQPQKLRERDLRRAKAAEQDAKNRADAEKKDGKDERMEELLRKVGGELMGQVGGARATRKKSCHSLGFVDNTPAASLQLETHPMAGALNLLLPFSC